MKWEVIERQTQGETTWDVTNGFWTFTTTRIQDAEWLVAILHNRGNRPGDATKSLIACAEDALSIVVGGGGPALRGRVTDSLHGTLKKARRILGDS